MPETEPLRATDVHREVDLGYIFCLALFNEHNQNCSEGAAIAI
jgi:hypothetical protein